MQLIRLRLENFRQHQDTVIEFRDGMTAIVGANGTGKSTILEGITYALYGTQRETREHIRFYWGDKKKYLAQLSFDLDGKSYLVERSNTDAKLTDASGANLLATGLTDVRRACEKLLGLTYDQFINSFCAEQKNLSFLNFRNSAARQDEVARMLGFDRLKLAEEAAKSKRALFKAQAEALERTLGDAEEIKKAKSAAEAQLAAIEKESREIEADILKLQKQMEPALESKRVAEQFKSLTQEMEKLASSADDLKQALALAEKYLHETKEDVESLRKIEGRESDYRRFEAESKEWAKRREQDRQRESLSDQLKTLKCDLVDLEERLAQTSPVDLARLERDLLGATESCARIEGQIREMEGQWMAAKGAAQDALGTAQALENIARLSLEHRTAMAKKGLCPECGQALGDGYDAILRKAAAEHQELVSAVQKREEEAGQAAAKPPQLEKLDAELASARILVEKARKAKDLAVADDAQATTIRNEKTKKAEQIARLEAVLANTPAVYDASKHEAAKASLASLEEDHTRFLKLQGCLALLPERERDHLAAKANYEAAKTKYRTLEASRRELPVKSLEMAEAAIRAHLAIEVRLRDQENCLAGNKKTLGFAKETLAAANKWLEDQKKRQKELDEARQDGATYDVVAREMRNLREHLNRGIGPDLVARASENLNLLTNGRYSALELDKDFQATVVEDGVAKAVISGGEEDVVALALRLALSELIQERNGRPMSLLVLDEVFGALDAERRQSVLERLAALKGRFRQILVISHIEDINQVADQALYVRRDPETRAAAVSDVPPELNYSLD